LGPEGLHVVGQRRLVGDLEEGAGLNCARLSASLTMAMRSLIWPVEVSIARCSTAMEGTMSSLMMCLNFSIAPMCSGAVAGLCDATYPEEPHTSLILIRSETRRGS